MALAVGPPTLLAVEREAIARRVPVRVFWNPGGDAGIYQTLNQMRDAANAASRHAGVRALAGAIVGDEPEMTARWRLLREWLAMHTQFRDDPRGLELVRTPLEQLVRIRRDGVMRGDCDDVATLAAALTQAVGARARFVVLGFLTPGPSAPYRHVYAEMQTAPDVWRDFDVTRRPASLLPTRRATLPV